MSRRQKPQFRHLVHAPEAAASWQHEYIPPEADFEAYHNQPVEKDARDFAEALVAYLYHQDDELKAAFCNTPLSLQRKRTMSATLFGYFYIHSHFLAIDNCQLSVYIIPMISMFRHKGLEAFHHQGSKKGILPAQEKRLRGILAFLEAAVTVADMDVPGLNLHALKGDRQEYWAVKVDGNYRVIFRFVNGNAYDVDVVDYH